MGSLQSRADGGPQPRPPLRDRWSAPSSSSLGIVGFFHDLSWLNYLYVASGALGLLLAGAAPRPYALCIGVIYTGLAA